MSSRILFFLFCGLAIAGCSSRAGYDILQQVGYQECLRQSARPLRECQPPPEYELYRQERELEAE